MDELNNMVKSMRVGTVDFFGILLPGLLAVVVCAIGFFIPVLILILDFTGTVNAHWIVSDPTLIAFILFVLIVLSYILGYILRLSSPDELDRISAKYVIEREKKISKYFLEDEWPYDFNDPLDKYPYFNFRNYLIRRGHTHLTKDLVTWGPDEKVMNGEIWPATGNNGKSIRITKRSKSTVNKMKIDIRIYCPELTGLLESKEGHIRLMAGTWAAFKFSKRPVQITLLIVVLVALLFQMPGWLSFMWRPHQNYFICSFVVFTLLMVVSYSNRRIEKLFHYRRVSELFHIVQAAYIAQQKRKEKQIK
jgi:hypothetical protein